MAISVSEHTIVVNGNEVSIKSGITIAVLLQQLDLDGAMVAVERNSQIVPRSEFGSRRLEDGDRVEIVHFVGGG